MENEVNEVLSVLQKKIPISNSGVDPYHDIFAQFVAGINTKNDPTILEIGSRNVSGNVRKDLFSLPCEYVGFDIVEGENVHVVGDAHELSEHFPRDKFDAVFSISVFEHLLMPWKVVLEINRILKKGGILFISTHPTWSAHELPWDFWRFQKNAFVALLNKYTGFEIVRIEEGLPCRIISLVTDIPTRGLIHQPAYLGVGVIAKKINDFKPDLKWDVPLREIISTMYPEK